MFWCLCVTHRGWQSVGHELELSVRRDELDGTISLESGQPHTLVEPNVLHFDRLPSSGCMDTLSDASKSES